MSVLWQIEYEGEIRPLRQWGIESIQLDLYNQATDLLTLVVAGEAANDDPAFAFEGRVVLWRDGVRVFHGIITQLPFSAKASSERQEYIVSNPWYYLENVVFAQPRYLLADARTPSIGFAMQAVQTPRMIMYQGEDGAPVTAGAQAQVAADYAASKAALTLDGEVPFTRGTFAIALLVPWEAAINLSCAEVIRRCTRWARDCVAYWDYSGAKPQLEIQRRADLDAVTLDLDDGDKIADFKVGSRPDLVPRGVVIQFERTITDPVSKAQFVQIEEQTAGEPDRGVRNLFSTLPLSGTGDGAEEVPAGLAQAIFDSLSDLQWQGRIVLREADPAIDLKPGVVLNLANGKTQWATMRAVIQSVTVDLAGRQTTAEFGPASQLGPQDLLDQIRLQRGEAAGVGATDRFEGTPPGGPQKERQNPPSNPPGGSPPSSGSYNAKEIQICEGGQKKKIKVGLV